MLFPADGRWPEPGLGVVTFEDGPASVPRDEQPVWAAAHALAARLGAHLVGGHHTAYEG